MAFTDRVRDKWEAITPRERAIVVFGAAGAVVIIILWLALSIRGGLTKIEARNAKMERALDALQVIRARGPQKPVDDVTTTIGTEPVELESYLAKAAQAVQIPIPPFNPRTAPDKNGFRVKMVSTELHGLTIQQLKDFLEKIETGNKLVVITSMNLSRGFNDKEKLDARLDVQTYYRPPADSGGGAGSGSGSGSGSASGSSASASGGS